MFLHHFVCNVHFRTVQKHTGIETIPHFYWKNDKGVEPANAGFQPAFLGDFVKGVEANTLTYRKLLLDRKSKTTF